MVRVVQPQAQDFAGSGQRWKKFDCLKIERGATAKLIHRGGQRVPVAPHQRIKPAGKIRLVRCQAAGFAVLNDRQAFLALVFEPQKPHRISPDEPVR